MFSAKNSCRLYEFCFIICKTLWYQQIQLALNQKIKQNKFPTGCIQLQYFINLEYFSFTKPFKCIIIKISNILTLFRTTGMGCGTLNHAVSELYCQFASVCIGDRLTFFDNFIRKWFFPRICQWLFYSTAINLAILNL